MSEEIAKNKEIEEKATLTHPKVTSLKQVRSSASLSEKLPGEEDNINNPEEHQTEIQHFKDEIKAGVNSISNFWDEFKDYLEDAEIFDSSVIMVTGQAFTEIANSFVQDIIVPLFTTLIGRPNATNYFVVLKKGKSFNTNYRSAKQAIADGAHIFHYGKFIQKIVNFVFLGITLIGFVRVFRTILFFRRLRKLKEEESTKKLKQRECPFCFSTINSKASRCPNCTSALPTSSLSRNISPTLKPALMPPMSDDPTLLN
ncbi:hypothetical protein K502DRAFT_286704 [Neoconidiobolus thromboides FSU 785]|nr:hypothetical protein K502DRAFT_286704 [Neoconidiobolus thromboides FSU 785]